MGYIAKSEWILAYWSDRREGKRMKSRQWGASSSLSEYDEVKDDFCRSGTFYQCIQEEQIAYDLGFWLGQIYFMFSILSLTKPTVWTFGLDGFPFEEK